eukprot:TRINITY_DN4268_c0_g1_i1.p1 TRINITY_DN4268_c0_g1~~TRINITY_DN4268_c0_g1_i1.p1  ORF type:complete len:1254 (-),score=128.99 TRINITY_DN4268_c0_g1_i1:58-3819(-)
MSVPTRNGCCCRRAKAKTIVSKVASLPCSDDEALVKGSNTSLIVGVIDQETRQAVTIIVDSLSPPKGFATLLAKVAERTRRPTRRLFLPDGTEISTVDEFIEHARHARDCTNAPKRQQNEILISMEVIATDGVDFQHKWGDHAEYRFGDLMIRPMYRRLFGVKRLSDIKHPPQPSTLAATGNLKDIMPDFFVSLFKICDRYGPLVKLRVFDTVIYVCQDADMANIINELPDKRIPHEVYGEKGLASTGVFIADGQQWEFGRRCLQERLTPETIDTFVQVYIEKALQFINVSKAGGGRALDVYDWAQRLTMDVICRIGFGHDANMLQSDANHKDLLVQTFDECLDISFNAAYTGGVDLLGNGRRQYAKKSEKLNSLLDDIINSRASNSTDGGSLVDHILKAKCPVTGRSFHQEEVRDQLVTLLVAGHKTSSLIVTWCLYHAASQPAVEDKLVRELQAVFGNDMERPPEAHELRKLKYMDLVIREALRLSSPVQTVQRSIVQPVKVGEYTLLPGGHSGRGKSYCAVHLMGISRSERYWGADALQFRPERFEPENVAKMHPYQFMPFGGGKRLCIGNLFAITQVKTVLSIVLRRYHLRLTTDKPVRIDPYDMAAPLSAEKGGGVFLQFTERAAWDAPKPPVESAISGLPDVAQIASRLDAHGREIMILWGGEFGTTKKIALGLWEACNRANFKATLKACGEVSLDELSRQGLVVVCCATYNSHPPPNAAPLLEALQQQASSKNPAFDFSRLEYAVLATGNSNWVSSFAKIGKEFDKALDQCGAQRLFPVEIADKNDEFERQAVAWRSHLFDKLGVSALLSTQEDDLVTVPPSYLSLEGDTSAEASQELWSASEENRLAWIQQLGYHIGLIEAKVELCSTPVPASDKYRSVKLLRISLPDGATYKAGDHLEVVPFNPMELIERLCKRLGVSHAAVLQPTSSRDTGDADPREMLAQGKHVSVLTLLGAYVDLQAVPSQEALAAFAEVAEDPEEKKSILALASASEQDSYKEWAKDLRSFVAALEQWPSVRMTLTRLVEIAPVMQPRLYSIASSPMVSDRSVELCCGIVKYDVGSSTRHGLCSNWLVESPQTACKVRSCPHMYLPEDIMTPIMCVCGGTGIAPFLGFLQERAAQKRSGANVGKVSIYFGCRSDYDFVHREQLQAWTKDGVCELSVSFSRKQGLKKEYVQHALQRDAGAVRTLLAPNSIGRFYLCGSASTLAKDCIHTIADILGNGILEEGHSQIQKLQDSGRMSLDVWG